MFCVDDDLHAPLAGLSCQASCRYMVLLLSDILAGFIYFCRAAGDHSFIGHDFGALYLHRRRESPPRVLRARPRSRLSSRPSAPVAEIRARQRRMSRRSRRGCSCKTNGLGGAATRLACLWSAIDYRAGECYDRTRSLSDFISRAVKFCFARAYDAHEFEEQAEALPLRFAPENTDCRLTPGAILHATILPISG